MWGLAYLLLGLPQRLGWIKRIQDLQPLVSTEWWNLCEGGAVETTHAQMIADRHREEKRFKLRQPEYEGLRGDRRNKTALISSWAEDWIQPRWNTRDRCGWNFAKLVLSPLPNKPPKTNLKGVKILHWRKTFEVTLEKILQVSTHQSISSVFLLPSLVSFLKQK